jgi:hypothetical protein
MLGGEEAKQTRRDEEAEHDDEGSCLLVASRREGPGNFNREAKDGYGHHRSGEQDPFASNKKLFFITSQVFFVYMHNVLTYHLRFFLNALTNVSQQGTKRI